MEAEFRNTPGGSERMNTAQVEIPFSGARTVRAVFDAKPISSDGGALLLRQVDRRLGLLNSLSTALPDQRDPRYVEHTLLELLQQRVYGSALGYEDCNDATRSVAIQSSRPAATVTRWPRSYRVLIKAEHQAVGTNLRFVVTTLQGRAKDLYDECYVARGEACENSIKDLKNALKADRLSCHRFWANQFRLLLHSAAYVLMYELRRAA